MLDLASYLVEYCKQGNDDINGAEADLILPLECNYEKNVPHFRVSSPSVR